MATLTTAQAEAELEALIESRITLALTPAVRAKLAARGYSEDEARGFLRAYVARTLDA
jgi:hypothetical protein